MTVLLPDDDVFYGETGPSARAGVEAADRGASLVRPRPETGRALARADADAALAGAVQGLEDFVRALPAQADDPDAWPGLFDGETARLRDGMAGIVADGPERDRFDTDFDRFARAKAVETRILAARQRVARSRAGLRRTLDAYAGIAAQAISPIASEFAREKGAAAIRAQAEDGLLSDREANETEQRFHADLAERRARQFVRDDPDAAAREFGRARGDLFPGISHELRAKFRDEAVLRRAAIREAEENDTFLGSVRTASGALSRCVAFEADFHEALRAGTASPVAIADALAGEEIDVATAERLNRALVADRETRRRRAELADATDARLAAGERLDPDDPADAEAADAWVAAIVEGEHDVLDRMLPGDWGRKAKVLREAEHRLGFRTGRIARLLDLYWSSGDPELMRIAADAEPDDAPPSGRGDFRLLVEAGLPPALAAERIMRREGDGRAAEDGASGRVQTALAPLFAPGAAALSPEMMATLLSVLGMGAGTIVAAKPPAPPDREGEDDRGPPDGTPEGPVPEPPSGGRPPPRLPDPSRPGGEDRRRRERHDADPPTLGDRDPVLRNRPVVQPAADVDTLLRLAREAESGFGRDLQQIANDVPGVRIDPPRVKPSRERLDEKIAVLQRKIGRRNGSVESRERGAELIEDYLAGRIVVDTHEDFDRAIASVREKFDVVATKDYIGKPQWDSGYSALHLQIRLANGMTAELQIVPAPFARAAQETRRDYEENRRFHGREADEESDRRIKAANARSREIFARARREWDRADRRRTKPSD